ncbi:hypothetical protein GW916_09440 [bacterium]|nr:hypothetical protein [bacterium]
MRFLLVFAALSFWSEASFAQSQTMMQFLNWEAEHNVGSYVQGVNFKQEELPIRYLEINLEDDGLYKLDSFRDWIYGAEKGPHGITIDFANYLPEDIRDFFIFQKNGKKFLRWPIHPMDQSFYRGIMDYLVERKVEHRLVDVSETQLRGYRTSSKSTILKIPGTNRTFSFKTGTNDVGQREGFPRPNPSRWAHFNRALSDYFYSQKDRLKTLDVAWEAGAIMFPPHTNATDNSINIRLMENVSQGEKHQLTGFVLHDKKEINRICKINGMTPDAFKKKISLHFGEFLAEMNLVLGFRVMSAHLQNVRFELDKDLLPTGKVIMLDLTDGGPVEAIFNKNGHQQLFQDWKALVSDTSLQSGTYFPNRVIENPVWEQGELKSIPQSSWFKPMDIASMHEGFLSRAKELGDFDKNISFASDGTIKFHFQSNEELVSAFRPRLEARRGCTEDFVRLLRD